MIYSTLSCYLSKPPSILLHRHHKDIPGETGSFVRD